ncbi:GH15 family glucan-1,4-alpha-glucosidase [Microbacterium foliorum]|uniref:glycoside hydrolase family 15 protein n=1 Tax=Microbacterium foliorum TaxID=104336 RepID=UPI0020A0A8C5|nr:glycoside hydrolase family 15 protein [Microbacterium foliorum]MCP1427545.1 GH15 family glucan-1,4-alpha-glucosidase [Microbacterium foliorum]
MPAPIEDYALLSDCRTGALVSREGSIDWLCLPRFDAPSLFGALLGEPRNGCWGLRPTEATATSQRHYVSDTFLLVTRWETADGVAEVQEFMPLHPTRSDVVRRIVGIAGRVEFATELRLHFDYSRRLPWVRQVGSVEDPALHATAGPEAVIVRGVRLVAEDHVHRATFTVAADEVVDLTLSWFPSHEHPPKPLDVDEAMAATRSWWQGWASGIEHEGPYRDEVVRSLLVLRALTNKDTGGIVAAATTSLPEEFGGARNWDYRFVWLRDAALTLEALIAHGFLTEAHHWRRWLLRAVAGEPSEVQIMYGIAGERDLVERELSSLPGYDGAAPVRIGNGAVDQYQGDVIGEVLVALECARIAGLEEGDFSWPLQRALIEQVIASISRRDNGIWEIRGEPQWFTHSRVMMWAALDRGVRAVQEQGLTGDAGRWAEVRDGLRREIDERGVDAEHGYFTQHYGSTEVDASLLVLPQVGYCAPDDPRMLRTVEQIESTLLTDGFVRRYRTESGVDGLEGGEHPFIACSFWLVEQYASSDRLDDARDLMERLVAMANDLGLLSEEYDVANARQAGNTPQALSHLSLIRAADALAGHAGRSAHRR